MSDTRQAPLAAGVQGHPSSPASLRDVAGRDVQLLQGENYLFAGEYMARCSELSTRGDPQTRRVSPLPCARLIISIEVMLCNLSKGGI